MKKFHITLHSDDTECVVTAENEEEADEKFWNGEIDEWLTEESYQPETIIKPYEENQE